MNDIIYAYSRPKRELGRPADFHDAPPEILIDIMPEPLVAELWTKMDPVETEIQCAPDLSEHWTNTERITYMHRGQHHVEGGWPKEIDIAEAEHKARYRKKTEAEDTYTKSLPTLAMGADTFLRQNNAIDVYEQYFNNDEPQLEAKAVTLRTLTVLGDPSRCKSRTPTYVSWNPSEATRLAVAYCNLSQMGPSASSVALSLGEPIASYVWDITNTGAPEVTFQPPSPLTALQFHPKETHLLAGGCYNGLICGFDVRNRPRASLVAGMEDTHRHIVHDLQWLTKSAEFMSVSTDGHVLLWDTRQLLKPVDNIILRPPEDKGTSLLGGICLDYSPTCGGSSKFMVGTNQGFALTCTRRGRSPNDRTLAMYHAHYGPAYAVHHHPQIARFFLTAGDWRVCLWDDGMKSPIYASAYHAAYLTGACWHPHRSAVFLTIQSNGVLEVWDLLQRQTTAAFSIQIADAPLHCMRVNPAGQLLAIGTSKSTVHLRELDPSFSSPASDETVIVASILEAYARNNVLRQPSYRWAVTEPQLDLEVKDPDEVFFYQLTTDYITSLDAAGIATTAFETADVQQSLHNYQSFISANHASTPSSPSPTSSA